MRIIALADTHSRPLPKALLDEILSADLVLHAGDFSDIEVYEQLKALKEVRAVHGNIDGADLRKVLPKQAVFDCAGVRIGLAHGEGSPEGIVGRLAMAFEGSGAQVVVFGHSHTACNETVNGVLFFNPGSPTDTVRAPYLSYGVIEANDGKFKARIVKLK